MTNHKKIPGVAPQGDREGSCPPPPLENVREGSAPPEMQEGSSLIKDTNGIIIGSILLKPLSTFLFYIFFFFYNAQ